MPAALKTKSREASSCWRRCGRSTSSNCPFHLRTLPATITVSTLVRSISDTTAPGTWLSGATLILVASRMMMSASLPGVSEPVFAVEPQRFRTVHRPETQHVARRERGRRASRRRRPRGGCRVWRKSPIDLVWWKALIEDHLVQDDALQIHA